MARTETDKKRNTFVLRTSYASIFTELPVEKAGALVRAIFVYVTTGKEPEFLELDTSMAFKFIKKDIDYDAEKYAEVCAKRAEIGRKGGLAKATKSYQKLANVSKSSKSWHIDNDVDVDNDYNKQHTSALSAASAQKPTRKRNRLQVFSNCVLTYFEPEIKTNEQKRVWFKRNARCLSDILAFCENSLEGAILTISECIDWLQRNHLDGGYEAVIRNASRFYPIAKQKLQKGFNFQFTEELQKQIKELED